MNPKWVVEPLTYDSTGDGGVDDAIWGLAESLEVTVDEVRR